VYICVLCVWICCGREKGEDGQWDGKVVGRITKKVCMKTQAEQKVACLLCLWGGGDQWIPDRQGRTGPCSASGEEEETRACLHHAIRVLPLLNGGGMTQDMGHIQMARMNFSCMMTLSTAPLYVCNATTHAAYIGYGMVPFVWQGSDRGYCLLSF